MMPLALAITGVAGSVVAVSIGCHCPSTGCCMPSCRARLIDARKILERRFFQAQRAVDSAIASRCHFQLLDLVSVFNGAEMLPQVDHHQQEQNIASVMPKVIISRRRLGSVTWTTRELSMRLAK